MGDDNSHGTADRTIGGAGSTRRQFMRTTGIGVGTLALGSATGSAQSETGEAETTSPPRLQTDGRWIVDPEGNRVKLRGMATASLEFIDYDWYPRTVEEVLLHATDGEDWHPNTVRLPITEDPVHERGMDYVVEDLLRPAVDLLANRGVYAMIDFHLIRPYVDAMGNAEGMVEDGWADDISGLGFDATVPTDDLLEQFWSAVAPEFADDENVLFELFNEPTLPLTWADYGEYGEQVESREDSWLLWRDAAQPWVDLIREEAPETPIVIGSPSWTSETQFAPEHPFEGENLIYSGHIYPANGQPEEFDDEYGAPAEDVPVVVTEFGWDPDEPEGSEGHGSTSDWGQPFREWTESYNNVGWLAWCFDDSWAPTFFESPADDPEPGVGSPWALKDGPEQSGGFVRQWLEDFRDHEPVWDSERVYSEGARVSWNNAVWEATWWTDTDEPRDADWEAWERVRPDVDAYGPEEWIAKADPSATEVGVDEWVTFEADDSSIDTRWITDLAWNFGDGTTAGGWWADHRYESTGTYTVTLTATDNRGNSTSQEVEITVS